MLEISQSTYFSFSSNFCVESFSREGGVASSPVSLPPSLAGTGANGTFTVAPVDSARGSSTYQNGEREGGGGNKKCPLDCYKILTL